MCWRRANPVSPDRATVVMVTWNAADLVGSSLASVPAGVDVVIVDNASRDGTVASARAERPDARVIELATNVGFAPGANCGISEVSAGPVLLLNPDCCLAPGALEHLLEFLELHPRAGLVSALVCSPDGRPERYAGGREPTLLSIAVHYLGLSRLLPRLSLYRPGPRAAAAQREWVAGTALLVRRAALDEVGALDESYFLYAEDHDWCRRMRAVGWEVWVTPGARAEHVGAASVRVADPAIRRHRITSLDGYYARHHAALATAAVRVVRVAGYAARAAVFFVAGAVTRSAAWSASARASLDDTRVAASLLRGTR